MQEVGLPQVFAGIETAFKSNDLLRVDALLWPALDQYPDVAELWFYAGSACFQSGKAALAAKCFTQSLELDPVPHVYANLGATYRRLNDHENGKRVLARGIEASPKDANALNNMGSMFVNEGCPHEGIPYLERAVEIGGVRGAQWNLALLYLESGRFGEGFDLYRKGLTHERQLRNYGSEKDGIPEPKLLEPSDPRADKTLIVYGEQGIGDELMMGALLKEAQADFGDVIFECHPRLVRLHQDAHPDLKIHPTRKEEWITWPIEDQVKADYKCPIGDLAAMYRRTRESFTAAWQQYGPTYAADVEEAASYRRQLEALADGRPIVGLAMKGGVLSTARTYRTIQAQEIERLFVDTNCLFVSLDYDDMLPFAAYAQETFGEDRYRWFPSIVQHYDYHHTAALVAACDLTVSVCQSVAHLSAGMGRPTRVLTPKRVAWRYGLTEEAWCWYDDPAIKLYRQTDAESWAEPIQRAIEDIRGLA